MFDELVGKNVVVRASGSGVWHGTLEKVEGTNVKLSNARKLWYWSGASSTSELANKGVSRPSQCKFPAPVDSVIVPNYLEIIPATEAASKSLNEVPVWTQH